jgi:hypothetical protein
MDPVTMALLVGAGGQLLSQAGTLIPTDIERSQKKELEKLKKMQEMNALGLTDKEQSAMMGRLSAGSEQVQQQAAQERARLLAGGREQPEVRLCSRLWLWTPREPRDRRE